MDLDLGFGPQPLWMLGIAIIVAGVFFAGWTLLGRKTRDTLAYRLFKVSGVMLLIGAWITALDGALTIKLGCVFVLITAFGLIALWLRRANAEQPPSDRINP